MVRAIVGANWGDEGKGKVTDLFAENSDIVVRFQGGANAGHTIINQYGKFALHLLPSGIFNADTLNIIGNGVALNIESLMEETQSIREKNINFNLLISEKAQVLLEHHKLMDIYEEERLGAKRFGSTKSGIAPFYSDKYSKTGIQVWELYDKERLRERLEGIYEKVNVIFKYLYGKPKINVDDVYEKLLKYGEFIKPYVADTSKILRDALRENKNILLEGQLGALKDTDHGIYPFVTSSSTLAGYASVGAGIPPYEIKNVTAVTKAYSSSVGAGPFVSAVPDKAEADELRRRGGDSGEFGATTGRPRDVGWFDTVATRYGCQVQGATEVCMTCLDVLSYLDKIKVCTSYECDGEIYDYFPNSEKLYNSKPVFTELKGWKCDIRKVEAYDELPDEAKAYVEFIEKQIGFKITMVSNGPERHKMLYR